MLRFICFPVVVVSMLGPGLAQEAQVNKTPEAVAELAMKAMTEGRMDEFSDLMHPEALERFKEIMVVGLEAAEKQGKQNEITAIFEGVEPENVKQLAPSIFLAAFLKGMIEKVPAFKETMASAKATMLGHVLEGESTAHVVFRMKASAFGLDVTKVEVMSLRKTEAGDWRMLLSQEIEGLANMFKQKYGADE